MKNSSLIVYFLSSLLALLSCFKSAHKAQSIPLFLRKNFVSIEQESKISSIHDLESYASQIIVLLRQENRNASGVIIGREGSTYYVLTVSHAVRGNSPIILTTSDRQNHEATVMLKDVSDLDVAILKFNSPESYKVATLADYNLSRTNQISGGNIYITGWKKGAINYENVFSCGFWLPDVLTTFIRQEPVNRGYEMAYTNPTQGGLSGGPLLDSQGKILGIHGRAEGEKLDILGEINIGLSLGIPSWKIVQVIREYKLPIPIVTDEDISFTSLSSSRDSEVCTQKLARPSSSDSFIEWANYANSMMRTLDFSEALNAYDIALEKNLNGELYQLWYARGLTLILLQRPREAAKNFEKAVELLNQIPSSVGSSRYERFQLAKALLLKYKGMILYSEQDYLKALESYDRALEFSPDNIQILTLKANVLNSMDRKEEALLLYQLALQNNFDPILIFAKIRLNIQLNQQNIALVDLNNLIESDPYNANAYALRSYLNQRIGDTLSADADIQKVREIIALIFDSELNSSSFTINYQELYFKMLMINAESAFPDYSNQNMIQDFSQIVSNSLSSFSGDWFSQIFAPELLSEFLTRQWQSQASENGVQGYIDSMLPMIEQMLSIYPYESRQVVISNGNRVEAVTEFDSSTKNTFKIMLYLQYFLGKFLDPQNDALQLFSETDIEQLKQEVEEAINKNKTSSSIYIAYATRSAFASNDGNSIKANNDFRKAAELAPSIAEVYYIRGIGHLILNNRQDALRDFQMVSQMSNISDDRKTSGLFTGTLNEINVMTIIDKLSY